MPQAIGAGPFTTFRYLDLPNGTRIWRAREHRKGLVSHGVAHPIWRSFLFNATMASGFAVGSFFFVIGAYLSLTPDEVRNLSLAPQTVNLVFFGGSIFFTLAAYLQLFQAANAASHPGYAGTPQLKIFGWRPDDPGWLASAIQFAGTLLFNANTFDAMLGGDWLRQDLLVWIPDIIGSILFLTSGYLTLIETCHKWFAWRPNDLAWWIVVVNFLGCGAFMVSAVLAFVPVTGAVASVVAMSTAFTLAGAVCFLAGAILTLRESALVRIDNGNQE